MLLLSNKHHECLHWKENQNFLPSHPGPQSLKFPSLFLLRARISVKQWETLVSVSVFVSTPHQVVKHEGPAHPAAGGLPASALTRKIVKVGSLVARRRVCFRVRLATLFRLASLFTANFYLTLLKSL